MNMCACGCGKPAAATTKNVIYRYARGHHGARVADAKFPLADMSKVILSPEDEDLRDRYRWRINARGYVIGGPAPDLIHRKIMVRVAGSDAIAGMHVDHINENKMDNRRQNLRIVTHAINQQNQNKRRPNKKSDLPRGVFATPSGRYQVVTTKRQPDGKQKGLFLGTYDTVQEAVFAFDRWKRENCPGYVPPEEREIA